jgi:plasmid stability protein
MARTTLVLDDQIVRQIKKKAAEEGRTFQAVANELLRQALAQPRRQPYRLNLQGWKGELLPAVDICDRNTLFDILDRK